MKIKKNFKKTVSILVQEPKNIELDKDTVKEIALDYIYKLRNWGPTHFIRGDLVHYENNRYVYPIDETRKATEEDYITEKIVQEIKES